MAKNSIESVVTLRNRQIVVLQGRLISQDATSVTFAYRPKAQRRNLQEIFQRSNVAAVTEDKLYVFRDTVLAKITGVVTTDPKTGFFEVDGQSFNPSYSASVADLGVPDSEAKSDGVKKKKKAK